MIGNVTSLTGHGLRDWLWQRFSAIIMVLYLFFLVGYFLFHPQITYHDWQNLFAYFPMRIFTVLALSSVLIHSWIGVWTVLTDYVTCVFLRLTLQAIVFISLFAYLIWGIVILWSA